MTNFGVAKFYSPSISIYVFLYLFIFISIYSARAVMGTQYGDSNSYVPES